MTTLAVVLGLAAMQSAVAKTVPMDNWKMESSANLPGASGNAISVPSYDDALWTGVKVPTTVLAGLQAAGKLPDLDYGDNLQEVDARLFDAPWWFRTCLDSGSTVLLPGEQATLVFHGINYRAALFVGGQQVTTEASLVGTFSYFRFDVSDAARRAPNGELCVALEIHRPHDVYWSGNATDLAIDFVDWSPDPTDGNMGLWRNVELVVEQGISLRDPTALLRLQPEDNNPAGSVRNGGNVSMSVSVELSTSVAGRQSGELAFVLQSVGTFSTRVDLAPGGVQTITIDSSSHPGLSLTGNELQPLLWWPHDLRRGTIVLLTLDVTLLSDSAASRTRTPRASRQSPRPGVPPLVQGSVSAEVGLVAKWSGLDALGGRVFRVNGEPFPVRGAGYAPDLFQRMSAGRHRAELGHAVTIGLNTLRFEGKFQDDGLLRIMDQTGVMALPGLCCCDAWQNWELWGVEQRLVANRSVHDQMQRMRGHPSMLGFLLSSDQLPPADVEHAYIAQAAAAGWSFPLIAAASAAVSPALGPTGVKMNGPYAWVPPIYWLQSASLGAYGGAQGFSTEISPGAAPLTLESWLRTVDEADVWSNADGGEGSAMWRNHCGNPHGLFRSLSWFTAHLEPRYGAVPSALDGMEAARQYLLRAQAAAFESHRAMFEAYRINQGVAGGVVQWMGNNAYPQHIWHLWDKYLNTGGSYFGVQSALQGVTALLNVSDGSLFVGNGASSVPLVDVRLRVRLVTLDGRTVFDETAAVSDGPVPAGAVVGVPVEGLDAPALRASAAEHGGVIFLHAQVLGSTLHGEDEFEAPSKVYWFSSRADAVDWSDCNFYRCNITAMEDFSALESALPRIGARLNASVVYGNTTGDALTPAKVALSLDSGAGGPAFFVRLRLVDAASVHDVVAFWSENFVTMLPGETRTVQASIILSDPNSPPPELVTEIWNDIIVA
jgi:exo-1,4-beta-D-glucosaminidase